MERITKQELELTQATTFMEMLDEMRKQEQYTDVILSCGGDKFSVHKVVLCASSDYFRSMFQSGMSECTSGSVDLRNVSREALAIVLRYLYTAKIEDVEDVALLKELLSTSHMLQLERLYNYYCQLLLDELTAVDFAELWDLVDLYNNVEVQEHVVSTLAKRFRQTRQSEDFLYLTKSRLLELLCHPELQCDVDEIACSIMEWIKHDLESRQEDLCELFATVPFVSASLQCLEWLKDDEIVQSSTDVILKLSDISASRRVQGDAPVLIKDLKSVPNSLEETKLVVCYKNEGTYCLTVYNSAKREWGCEERIPFAIHPCATVSATPDGDILFIGGASCAGDKIEPLDLVYKYNTCSKSLQYASRLLIARCRPGVGLFRGHVYVLGGQTSFAPVTCSNAVEKYNCVTGRWTSVANTVKQYRTPEVLQVLDCLHVVGLDNVSLDLCIEKYDLGSRQWSLIRRITDHHCETVAAAVWNQQIVLRFEDENNFHFIDPESGSFQDRTVEGGPTSISRMCSRNSTQSDTPIFISDGDNLYEFDPNNATNAWTQLTTPFPLSGVLIGLTTFS